MNNSFVADSSVGVAWAAPAQASEGTDELLRDVASGRPFVVPALWAIEVANALIILLRRRRMDTSNCQHARHIIGRLRPVLDDEGPQLTLSKTWDLAEQYGLSVYDATYLELALRKGYALASRDGALNKAARRSGVKTLLD
jgi:predicted nucleic acid-binding protein